MDQLPFAVRRFCQQHWRRIWLWSVLALYVGLATYQLGLPGLHYDEAREAGVNAMELLTGAPVTAFRQVSVHLFGWQLPVMVQDYIGALNVYLALPFLAITGIGVPNLRALAVLTGLAALWTLERAISEWMACHPPPAPCSLPPAPCSLPALLTLTLLAASPSFVFWSRQGIFVTNLTQPFTFCCLWQGLHWLRTGRTRALILSGLTAGFALYAKLLAIWVIGPFGLLVAGWWLWQQRRKPILVPALSWQAILYTLVAFGLPLLPLLWFDWQTGAANELLHKLNTSYYGVNNRDVLHNLPIRWTQLLQSLRGEQFWYLGGVYGNWIAPWLAGVALLGGLRQAWRLVMPPLLVLTLVFLCSLFTVSDLFITHYALVQPLGVAVVGIALATWITHSPATTDKPAFSPNGDAFRRYSGLILICLWLGFDLTATLRYHAALARSGGLADHSDATYHLAYYLRYHGLGAPVALDWGIDAPVRYLSEGTVTPIELFGYTSPYQPDAQFGQHLRPFLANPQNVYLLHAPAQTVFAGRREQFMQTANVLGLKLVQEQQFTQMDGKPLFELWRALP
ncbi:MAG: hypothetical protein U0350_05900 [Caldilineaceae bacterium]